jgi:serine/threonine protein kinase
MRDFLRTSLPPIRQPLTFCSHVTAGLAELHRSGVAHGDLKLENVLMSKGDRQLVAKLVS